MRKSIFDIAATTINISNEVDRLVIMFEQEKTLYHDFTDYTVFDFVDDYCFRDWGHRNHFLNVKDFVRAIEYNNVKRLAKNGDVDCFIILILQLCSVFTLLTYSSRVLYLKSNSSLGYMLELL